MYLKITLLSALCAGAFSCTKSGTPDPGSPPDSTYSDSSGCEPHWDPALGIDSISGTDTTILGETAVLMLAVTGRNSCAQRASVVSSASGFTITFTGNVWYDGCACLMALTNVPSVFSFTPSTTGLYHFKAYDWQGNLVTHSLYVTY